jgi:competence protein ComEC
VVAVAVVVSLAAWWSPAVPCWAALVTGAVAIVVRRPVTVLVAAGVVAACLGARAWQGDRPAPGRAIRATATLVTDPQEVAGAVVVEVRAEGHHFEVWAHGWTGRLLAQRSAGQRVRLAGRVAPRRPGDDLEARRHVIGTITPDQVEVVAGDGPVVAAVNHLRRVLLQGGAPLTASQRSLYGGFVLGDLSGQSPVVADDFRGSGLSHLLVVSGENVAFVLAAAAPLLRRFGSRSRWAATVGLLVLFAAMTRFEPSVLRATAMALIGVTAWSLGRSASGLRVLALAVTALVLVDPMLVGVAGFQLSVAASAGIIVVARPLAEHLPLPRWLAGPVSVTLAAQVAVSPILMAIYGGLPVATLPANLLAEPAAALLMGWGLTAGAVAGLVGGWPAAWLQWPAGALVWWVESVARWGAAVPLGQMGPVGLALGAAAAFTAVRAARAGRRVRAAAGWLVLGAVLVAPAVGQALSAPPAWRALGRSAQLWTDTHAPGRPGVLVVARGARLRDLLDGLRAARITRLDLVVVPTGSATNAALVSELARRVGLGVVWRPAPPAGGGSSTPQAGWAAVPGGRAPHLGQVARLGALVVVVTGVDPGLAVSVSRVPGVGSAGAVVPRAPPLRRDPPGPGDGHPQPHA